MRTVLNPAGPDAVRAELVDHGCLLLRRPGGYRPADFVALGDALMLARQHGAALADERELVGGDPTTTTVTSGSAGIPLHREASYAPASPALLMFYCERPASRGGETIVCDGVRLLAALPPHLRDFAVDAEIRWETDVPDGRWQAMCGAADPDAALAATASWHRMLMPWETLRVDFTGRTMTIFLGTRCVVPALFDAAPAFCNSVLITGPPAAGDSYTERRLRLRMADGAPFPAGHLAEIARVAADLTEPLPWRAGDIAVVNNTRVMHGRRAFTDPLRRILVRMGYLRTPATTGDHGAKHGATSLLQ
jgi:hypothetical protein